MVPARSLAVLRRSSVLVAAVALLAFGGHAPSAWATPTSSPTPAPLTEKPSLSPSPSPSPTPAMTKPTVSKPTMIKPTMSKPTGEPTTSSPAPSPSVSPSPSASAAALSGDGPDPAGSPAITSASAPPALAVTVSVPGTITASGQTVTYRVVVRNAGGAPAQDLAVSAVAANLRPLTCTPTAQGGTLAAGASTTCTATRASTQEDLRNHGGTVSATAAGFGSDGKAVSATASARLSTSTTLPTVTDDKVEVVRSAPYVILPATTNDSPASAGGPALVPSRTLFSPSCASGQPLHKNIGGTWLVLPDGSVEFVLRPESRYDRQGYSDSVTYRTYDAAGSCRTGTLSVVVRDGVLVQDDTGKDVIHGTQGKAVSADVLGNDTPGRKADGAASSFDADSLRFPADQPDGHALVTNAGKSLQIPRVGAFSAADGKVRFDPVRTFAGAATFSYQVSDRVGNVGVATAEIDVASVVPKVGDVSATSTPDHEVEVDLRSLPSSVTFHGFDSRAGTNLGGTVRTGQGTWSASIGQRSTAVFFPATGFSGVASIPFEVVDGNGTPATATMRVTVRRGWSATPDVARTTPGVDVTVDPLANDLPSQLLDGSAGSFDLARLRFSDSGQPSGATLDAKGKTITLKGRGFAWISKGKVTFRPQAGFSGYVGRLVLELRDEHSDGARYPYDTLSDRISVLVVGVAPVATDDSATTVLDTPVTLAGATNDAPGTAGPLTSSFPPGGQPAGAAVSQDGRTLTVPGEGTWSLNPSGTVTFRPEPGFVDGTAPVAYRVQGSGGASSTARLSVSVARGPEALADVLEAPRGYSSTLDPLINDLPGSNADGTPGSFDPGSIRFPVDGQPVGATVTYDGRVLTVPIAGGFGTYVFSAEDPSGLVGLQTPSVLGPTPAVRYQVQDTVTAATGTKVHHTTTATLQTVFVGRDPVAVDDSATTSKGQAVRLPGLLNDIPGSGVLRTDTTPYFPSDQLSALPAGSSIRFCCPDGWYSTWDAFVTGEGYWEIDPFEGYVTFHPDADFVGTTTPVRYRVEASDGGSDDGMLRVTVTDPAPTVLRADTGVTKQGVNLTLTPLANDTPGTNGLLPSRLSFVAGVPAGATVPASSDGTQLLVPDQGRYDIALDSGRVIFRPDPTFTGTASAVRLAIDGQESTLQVRVDPVHPTARADTATTTGAPVRADVLANDAAGTAARPLVPGSVRLTATGLPAGGAVSADGQLVTLPGYGTFVVAGDGSVTYDPLPGTTGSVPPVTYAVADPNGTRASATLSVRATAP